MKRLVISLILITLGIARMSGAEEKQESPAFSKMRAAKTVSIWLGNFTSEDELSDYLDGDFSKDFGFKIYPPAGPEIDVSASPKSIFDLLNGFSQYQSFQPEAAKRAEAAGWKTATTAVVLYNFRYDTSLQDGSNKGRLSFLGVIPYQAK